MSLNLNSVDPSLICKKESASSLVCHHPKASSLSRAFLANRAQRRGIYSFEVRRGSDDDGRVFKQHSINLSLMAFVGPSWPYHGFWWSWSKWWWFQLKLKSHPGHRVVTSHANLRNWWCTKWRFPLFGTAKSFPNSIQNLDLQRNGQNLSVREICFFFGKTTWYLLSWKTFSSEWIEKSG